MNAMDAYISECEQRRIGGMSYDGAIATARVGEHFLQKNRRRALIFFLDAYEILMHTRKEDPEAERFRSSLDEIIRKLSKNKANLPRKSSQLMGLIYLISCQPKYETPAAPQQEKALVPVSSQ